MATRGEIPGTRAGACRTLSVADRSPRFVSVTSSWDFRGIARSVGRVAAVQICAADAKTPSGRDPCGRRARLPASGNRLRRMMD